MWEADQGRTRHLEILQHAVIHQNDTMGADAFIIVFVISEEVVVAQSGHRAVVNDAEERRQNRLAGFLCEGLPFRHVFLAAAFRAMTENLIKKEGRRPSSAKREA